MERAHVLADTRASLPMETVRERAGADGQTEQRAVEFPRWNAADMQQTECNAAQLCKAFICRQYGAHRRHAPPKLIAPDSWATISVCLVAGAPGRVFQVPAWADEVHRQVLKKRKLVDPAEADARAERRRLVRKTKP